MLDDKTLEDLRREKDLIYQNADFWSKNIEAKGERLNFLLNRDNPEDFSEIESLSEEINKWQFRGLKEKKILEAYEKKSTQILFGHLLSGISKIEKGY